MAVQQGVRHRIAISDFAGATVAGGRRNRRAGAGADGIALGQTVEHGTTGSIQRHPAADQIGGESVVEAMALAKRQDIGGRALGLGPDRVRVRRGRDRLGRGRRNDCGRGINSA